MRFLSQHRLLARVRLWGAYAAYRCVRLFFARHQERTTMDGIRYALDLREAIDLATFLSGRFQRHIVRAARVVVPPDGVIVDVGANAGFLALPMAQLVPRGRVHAFEPTPAALKRLHANLALNPALAQRITVHPAFVSDGARAPDGVYSSWPLAGDGARHPVHGGAILPVDAPSVTLDAVCADMPRIDFIKIDTDGHELRVLRGARRTLARCRPTVVFELGQYLVTENNERFDHYETLLLEYGYVIRTLSEAPVTARNWRRHVPRWGTTDLLAIPQ